MRLLCDSLPIRAHASSMHVRIYINIENIGHFRHLVSAPHDPDNNRCSYHHLAGGSPVRSRRSVHLERNQKTFDEVWVEAVSRS